MGGGTAGNGICAKCKLLCQVSKIGHSAKKKLSAKDFFAECQALGKSAALGIGYPA